MVARGKERVRLDDDGCGMSSEQIEDAPMTIALRGAGINVIELEDVMTRLASPPSRLSEDDGDSGGMTTAISARTEIRHIALLATRDHLLDGGGSRIDQRAFGRFLAGFSRLGAVAALVAILSRPFKQ